MILNPVIQGGGGGANLVTATLDFEPKNGVTYTFLDENGTPKQIDGTGVYSMQAGRLPNLMCHALRPFSLVTFLKLKLLAKLEPLIM